jgi:MFS family permease
VIADAKVNRCGLVLYGLAYLGAHLAFIPLLVLLLPRRVESIAPENVTGTLSWLLLLGAIVAGVSHILAGILSDRWIQRYPNRRGLIVIGVAALGLSYALLAFARDFLELLAAVMVFQAALNCAFSPLGVLLTDHFPDHLKGRMGGIMNAALPAASLTVVLVGWYFPEDGPGAVLFTGLIALACIAPLLLFWPLGQAHKGTGKTRQTNQQIDRRPHRDFQIAWCARLAIQLGAAFVLGYIYVLLSQLMASGPDGESSNASSLLAALSAPASVIAIVATFLAGAVSDKAGRRRPLALAAAAFAAGLAMLSGAGSLMTFMVGYTVFYVGLSAFLSIDTALVAQLVSDNPRRGMLLGVMNLTNTLPAFIAPMLTLLAIQTTAIENILDYLLLACAGLASISAVAILFIRTVR